MDYKFMDTFIIEGVKYIVIGDDCSRNEIECQTVPFNGKYYWFKVVEEGLISLQ